MSAGWGGARRGAGRPRKEPALLDYTAESALEFLQLVMADRNAPADLRLRAAKALSKYRR